MKMHLEGNLAARAKVSLTAKCLSWRGPKRRAKATGVQCGNDDSSKAMQGSSQSALTHLVGCSISFSLVLLQSTSFFSLSKSPCRSISNGN